MKEKKLTRLKILRVMSYDLLHFLIKEKILSVFLTECLNNAYSIVLKDKTERTGISHDVSEFERYFIFDMSTTFAESSWWRYAIKYREMKNFWQRKHYKYVDCHVQFQQSK